jgi:hypothetical protein
VLALMSLVSCKVCLSAACLARVKRRGLRIMICDEKRGDN